MYYGVIIDPGSKNPSYEGYYFTLAQAKRAVKNPTPNYRIRETTEQAKARTRTIISAPTKEELYKRWRKFQKIAQGKDFKPHPWEKNDEELVSN